MIDEVWTTKAGHGIKVKDMDEAHVRAALSMILRRRRETRVDSYLEKLVSVLREGDVRDTLAYDPRQ